MILGVNKIYVTFVQLGLGAGGSGGNMEDGGQEPAESRSSAGS